MLYHVGMRFQGPEREVVVAVKRTPEEARTLTKVRRIEADSPDDAAKKYIELITGGTAALRRPN